MQISLMPHLLMRPLCNSDSDATHVNVLLSSALLAALFLWHDGLSYIMALPHICLFQYAFGLPCPGCDITSALAALAHFEVYRAFLIQPCGVVLAAAVLIQAVVRGLRLLRFISFNQTSRILSASSTIFISALLLFWVFRLVNH